MLRALLLLSGASLVIAAAGNTAVAADPVLKPVKEWSGKFPDDKDLPLMKLAPASGYLTDAKAFEKLWKAWRPTEETPKIDFDKEIVFVGTTMCAANRVSMSFGLKDGNLSVVSRSTLIAGPGFAYSIAVVPGEGVKTINGKPIAK
jgi:hypothetical protein